MDNKLILNKDFSNFRNKKNNNKIKQALNSLKDVECFLQNFYKYKNYYELYKILKNCSK